MSSIFPQNRRWTIRIIPWVGIVICLALLAPILGVIIFREDQRVGGGVALVTLLGVAAALIEVVVCELDLDDRTATLVRYRVFKQTHHQMPFDEIHAVSVQASLDSDSTTYQIVFVLNSGDIVPLTMYSSSGKGSKEKLARQIAAYVNQVRGGAVTTAMDGMVQIAHEGVTNGVRWKITFVVDNDQIPLTRWSTDQSDLINGFVLIIPAGGVKTSAMPTGMFGAAARLLYARYLKMLAIQEADLPGFESAKILAGESLGIGKGSSIVATSAGIAQEWLTPVRVEAMRAWAAENPLKASDGAKDPHVVITRSGIEMTYRGKFNAWEQQEQICRLGVSLAG